MKPRFIFTSQCSPQEWVVSIVFLQGLINLSSSKKSKTNSSLACSILCSSSIFPDDRGTQKKVTSIFVQFLPSGRGRWTALTESPQTEYHITVLCSLSYNVQYRPSFLTEQLFSDYWLRDSGSFHPMMQTSSTGDLRVAAEAEGAIEKVHTAWRGHA